MREYEEVTEEQYNTFLENYPRPLKVNIVSICDPPMETHNDFSGGMVWPDSAVAGRKLNEVGPHQYFILTIPEDIDILVDELFNLSSFTKSEIKKTLRKHKNG